MKLTLTWVNRNVGEDGTRLYRSTTPFDGTSLPAVLVTLNPGVQSYDDTTVVRDTTYYYRWQVFKGSDTTLSNQVIATATPRSGPGPQLLIAGDYEIGYFGEVTSAQFFSGEEIAALVGVTQGASLNSSTNWLKFAYQGKILFIPKLPIRQGVTWANLYTAGVVFGDATVVTAMLPTGQANNTAQNKIITKAGENFCVRMIRGSATNPATPMPIVNSPTSTFYEAQGYNVSEWDDLMVRVASLNPPSQVGDSLGAIVESTLVQDSYGPTMCMEVTTAANILSRGHRVGAAIYMAPGFNTSYTSTTCLANALAAANVSWRPVLEYRPS